MATERTYHLMHASTEFSDPARYFESDIKAILDLEPDSVSLTETGDRHGDLRDVLKGTGYVPVFLPSNENEAFIVRVHEHAKVKSRGAIKVHEGNPAPPSEGGYPARFISWVEIHWYGEKIFHHVSHWVTLRPGERDSAQRRALHTRTTKQMAAQVRKHAQGKGISFFGGDINVDEQKDNRSDASNMPNQIFRDEGLLTIWDEFKVTPSTHDLHGGTIDILGSFNPDKRVTGKRYKVHPLRHSDHRPISAFYNVKQSQGSGVGGNHGGHSNGGSNGGGSGSGTIPPKDPDFYTTGGNQDWSDYMDGAIYDLPYAVDDSDGSNH